MFPSGPLQQEILHLYRWSTETHTHTFKLFQTHGYHHSDTNARLFPEFAVKHSKAGAEFCSPKQARTSVALRPGIAICCCSDQSKFLVRLLWKLYMYVCVYIYIYMYASVYYESPCPWEHSVWILGRQKCGLVCLWPAQPKYGWSNQFAGAPRFLFGFIPYTICFLASDFVMFVPKCECCRSFGDIFTKSKFASMQVVLKIRVWRNNFCS